MTLTDALLAPLLARDPMGPRITYYDDATGERIELSTVTLANWAAKTANLLRDELGAGPGSRVAVLLPAHWQTAAVLLGVWWIGAEVVLAGPADRASAGPADRASAGPADRASAGPADLALCTAERLDEADAVASGGEVAVLSLDPFGAAVDGLPLGVTDYATAVRVHGDQVLPEPAPGPALGGRSVSEVLGQARTRADEHGLTAADRVLSANAWTTPQELIDNFVAVLAAGASLVQVANPDPALNDKRRVTEKVTRTLSVGSG